MSKPQQEWITHQDWIPHDGLGMPVRGKTLVIVRARGGFVAPALKASYWSDEDPTGDNWTDDGSDACIVAYKLAARTRRSEPEGE